MNMYKFTGNAYIIFSFYPSLFPYIGTIFGFLNMKENADSGCLKL